MNYKEEGTELGCGGHGDEVVQTKVAEGAFRDDAGGAQEDTVNGRKGSPGFVYFIQTEDGSFVKIGYSIWPIRRMSQLGPLRPGNFKLKLIGYVTGSRDVEHWLHSQLRAERDQGEWFRDSLRLRQLIEWLDLTCPIMDLDDQPDEERDGGSLGPASVRAVAEWRSRRGSCYRLNELQFQVIKELECGAKMVQRIPRNRLCRGDFMLLGDGDSIIDIVTSKTVAVLVACGAVEIVAGEPKSRR